MGGRMGEEGQWTWAGAGSPWTIHPIQFNSIPFPFFFPFFLLPFFLPRLFPFGLLLLLFPFSIQAKSFLLFCHKCPARPGNIRAGRRHGRCTTTTTPWPPSPRLATFLLFEKNGKIGIGMNGRKEGNGRMDGKDGKDGRREETKMGGGQL